MNEDIFHLGVKAIIRNHYGEMLLLKANPVFVKSAKKRAFWDLPGGRIRRGDTIEETLKREVEEETGITSFVSFRPLTAFVMPVRIVTGDTDVGLIFSVYLCEVNEIYEIRLSKEHTEARWAAPSEAAHLLGRRYPKEFIDLELRNVLFCHCEESRTAGRRSNLLFKP